jgi:hypothetical protein
VTVSRCSASSCFTTVYSNCRGYVASPCDSRTFPRAHHDGYVERTEKHAAQNPIRYRVRLFLMRTQHRAHLIADHAFAALSMVKQTSNWHS